MENKKCLKCNISKCKAACCVWVPMPISFIEQHQNDIVREIIAIRKDSENGIGHCITHLEQKEVDGKMVGYVDQLKQYCPFLTEDLRCNIYRERPEICKCFGTKLSDDHPFTCHYHIGRDYHFPYDKDSPEFKKINNIKYFRKDYLKNKRLIKQMFPNNDVNETISYLERKLLLIEKSPLMSELVNGQINNK